MVPTIGTRIFVLSLTGLCIASLAWAHITPPVVLMTERQAVVAMLEGASSYSVREVRLSLSSGRPYESGGAGNRRRTFTGSISGATRRSSSSGRRSS